MRLDALRTFKVACALVLLPLALVRFVNRVDAAAPSAVGESRSAAFAPKADEKGNVLAPSVATVKLGAGRTLEVKVRMPARCVFGDHDAIVLERTVDREGKVFIALEDLVGDTRVAVPLDETVLKGKEVIHRLRVPATSGPSVMGLFVCKASNQEESCKSVPAIPINQVISQFDPHANVKPSLDGLTGMSKSYFFGHLLLDGTEVSLVPSPISKDTVSAFGKLAADHKVPGAERALALVDRNHRLLGSEPLAATETGIELALPFLDPTKCEKPPEQPVKEEVAVPSTDGLEASGEAIGDSAEEQPGDS